MSNGSPKYVPPSITERAFNCPHCDALAKQTWYSLRAEEGNKDTLPRRISPDTFDPKAFDEIKDAEEREKAVNWVGEMLTGEPFIQYNNDTLYRRWDLFNANLSRCFNCDRIAIWVGSGMVYRPRFAAIKVIYNSLDEDVKQADISDIMRALQGVVDESIEIQSDPAADGDRLYDISKIDFEKLKREFARSPKKNTTVQSLKDALQRKLELMLRQNPTRTDFQRHYEDLVAEYNSEKDAVNIERVFEALLVLAGELDEEQRRAVREGLTEETQALFDLLMKPDLEKADIKRLKQVAVGLYDTLQAQIEAMQDFAAKQATRDQIRVTIRNYLWDENKGLPVSYGEPEIEAKTDAVLAHLMMQAQRGGTSRHH